MPEQTMEKMGMEKTTMEKMTMEKMRSGRETEFAEVVREACLLAATDFAEVVGESGGATMKTKVMTLCIEVGADDED